jgi:uncharacterized protein HemX
VPQHAGQRCFGRGGLFLSDSLIEIHPPDAKVTPARSLRLFCVLRLPIWCGTAFESFRFWVGFFMNPLTRETRPYAQKPNPIALIGSQPIALAAAALLVLVAGIGAIALWRAYGGAVPEFDRVTATRQLQARTAQASEQLVEKTKGLEATQQESIDQLQMVQDQLQSVRHLLAAQQADTKHLSDQVATLTEAIDGLRQSFASAQSSDASSPPARNRSVRTRAHASRNVHHRARNRS